MWILGILVAIGGAVIAWLVRDSYFKAEEKNQRIAFDNAIKEVIQKLEKSLTDLQDKHARLEEKHYIHMIAMEGLLQKVKVLEEKERDRAEDERHARRDKSQ